jgi:hypothetical protein
MPLLPALLQEPAAQPLGRPRRLAHPSINEAGIAEIKHFAEMRKFEDVEHDPHIREVDCRKSKGGWSVAPIQLNKALGEFATREMLDRATIGVDRGALKGDMSVVSAFTATSFSIRDSAGNVLIESPRLDGKHSVGEVVDALGFGATGLTGAEIQARIQAVIAGESWVRRHMTEDFGLKTEIVNPREIVPEDGKVYLTRWLSLDNEVFFCRRMGNEWSTGWHCANQAASAKWPTDSAGMIVAIREATPEELGVTPAAQGIVPQEGEVYELELQGYARHYFSCWSAGGWSATQATAAGAGLYAGHQAQPDVARIVRHVPRSEWA